MMSQAEYEAAIAQFLAQKAITRCPTACVTPTRISMAEEDRVALRSYIDGKEAARLERLRNFQQHLAR